MGTFLNDVRYGLRMLFKSPGFTLIAVFVLALGIGANTTIFSLINGLLLRPIVGVQSPESLAAVYTSDFSSGRYGSSSYPDYVSFREGAQAFEGLAAYEGASANLTGNDEPERLRGESVTANYFKVLGVTASAGRTLLPEDETTASGNPVVVISHNLWQRRFNSDPTLINRTINLDGRAHTVVGVAAKDFRSLHMGLPPEFWQTLLPPPNEASTRGSRGLQIVGRLKRGATTEEANAQVTAIMARLAQDYPETNRGTLDRPNEPRPVSVVPESRFNPKQRQTIAGVTGMLMLMVGLVLLIACANVANLLLARASVRRREIAIRLALGSSRMRLVRQLLTESMCLALLGGFVGLLLTLWTSDFLPKFFPAEDAGGLDLSVDWRVLSFTLGLSMLTGIVFGLAPALQASRPDLLSALKDDTGAPEVRGFGRFGLRNALVVLQVALSLVLLICAGLFMRSLRAASTTDPGFNAENVLLTRMEMRGAKMGKEERQLFYSSVQERVSALPGVRSAALSYIVPISGGGMRTSVWVEGYQPKPNEDTELNTNIVSPNYFKTMGIPLVQGRDFSAADTANAPGVVVINEEFERRYFNGASALGKRVRTDSEGPYLEVIGIAKNAKYRGLSEEPLPFFYTPLAQGGQSSMALLVRTDGDPLAMLPPVRAELKNLDKNLTLYQINTLSAQLAEALSNERMVAVLLSVFGVAALLLAAVGLYGVMSYAVARRTHEIGVRMALGAQPGDIMKLVLWQGMALLLVGSVVGLAAAYALTRLLSSLLYGVSATDPATFVGITLLLAFVALLACYFPARRATKVDPMVALRYE
ncbi:MAG TPA: ABC transporter permease [Pyrinomonadaceae bacterium]|jgi:predicted permease|nr:ABC transporter permease [Pyrinomonadaceae bacterium]